MLTTSYPGGVLLPTLTIVNADGARVPNQALHKALLELSGLTSGQRLANANLRESVYRIFLGDKLMDGYVIANGEAEPVGSFDGQILLIGAKYGESPDVEIVEQVKLWNSSSSSWVEPNPSLFAKALLHLSGTTNNSQPTGCLFKLDSLIPVMKHYNDGTGEGWLKGEWVEKDGIYSLSVAGTPSEKNYVNPDITNPTDRAKYWKYSFTQSQLCEAMNSAVGSLLLSIFNLIGADVTSEVKISDFISALAASNSEALARVTDQKFLTPSNLPSLTATQEKVIAGTESTKFVTSATLQGKVATPAESTAGTSTDKLLSPAGAKSYVDGRLASAAEATAGTDATKLMTPATTDAAISAATTDGLDTWATGKDGSNGNAIVIGSDGKLYLANPKGQPANNDPTVAANRPTHWQGAFNSIGDMLAALAGAGSRPNGWEIDDVNCATGMIKFKKPDGTTCTMFTKELEGVSITAPTSAPARTTGLAASVTTPTNGTAPYTYHWTLPDGSTENTKDVTFIAPATAGTYTIKCDVTDANGMTTSKSQSITVEVPLPVILFNGNSGSSGTVTLSQNAKNFVRLYSEATPNHGMDWVRQWHVVAGPSVQNQGPCRTTTLSADGLTFTHEITSCDPGSYSDNYLAKVTGYYD